MLLGTKFGITFYRTGITFLIALTVNWVSRVKSPGKKSSKIKVWYCFAFPFKKKWNEIKSGINPQKPHKWSSRNTSPGDSLHFWNIFEAHIYRTSYDLIKNTGISPLNNVKTITSHSEFSPIFEKKSHSHWEKKTQATISKFSILLRRAVLSRR